jgi:hypothetical protein
VFVRVDIDVNVDIMVLDSRCDKKSLKIPKR